MSSKSAKSRNKQKRNTSSGQSSSAELKVVPTEDMQEQELRTVGDTSATAEDFSVDEEEFFHRGQEVEAPVAAENFEDLDAPYELPKTFWQRFLSDPRTLKKK